MRVRVWIAGEDGPSRDFELATAPRVGDGISISLGDHFEEGVVTSVLWQLVGIDRAANELVLGVEPVGSVTMVHVICQAPKQGAVLLGAQTAKTLVDGATALTPN